ncbi:hypothetical protein PDE_01579 [Penicillium oxalicum 114-2]|uniref:Vacuolar ATPase assembly protein VMA22 n=1 Tax=Penicillium oxalicum (strain 114-2 / CGMCC 5302) TaxID=933388 RepID=S7ZD82_PENO1|nr:hypothetical protein PDE_01579 [Penicillium oxalicum 114-2]
MSELPTPPPSRPGSEAPETATKTVEASAELLQSLDLLLESYLHLLDRQQALQSGLSKSLASGFLSLAHANYTCPPGRRYGADYYDERMKATRRISIHTKPAQGPSNDSPTDEEPVSELTARNLGYTFTVGEVKKQEVDQSPSEADATEKSSLEASEHEGTANEPPTHQTTGESEQPSSEDSPEDESTEKATKPRRKRFHSDNPLHWYGILVPASLRSAQKSFTEGIQTQVPDLAGTIIEMRGLEQKIRQVRAKIGIDTRGDVVEEP